MLTPFPHAPPPYLKETPFNILAVFQCSFPFFISSLTKVLYLIFQLTFISWFRRFIRQDAHDIILDFIRSRPPLAPAEERQLNPLPESSVTPRDRLMEELNQGEAIVDRLKPVPKPRLNANQQNGEKGACSGAAWGPWK